MQAFSLKNLIYIFLLVSAFGCSNYQKVVKEGTPQEKLDAARKYYKDKDYIRALPLLEELMGLYYGRQEREEVYYLYAYSYFADEQFLVAGYHFNNFVQTYPRSEKREEVAYLHALCKYKRSLPHELDQSPTKEAIEALQSFINQYPNSTYVLSSNEKIDDLRKQILEKVYENAKLYYSLGYYKSAMVSCANALEDYPDMINREELTYIVVESAFMYAENSVENKQEERYSDALAKAKDFNKEFKNSQTYSKDIKRIIDRSNQALKEVS